ncbi:MAG: SCO family protein [Chloroflexota bacterium]
MTNYRRILLITAIVLLAVGVAAVIQQSLRQSFKGSVIEPPKAMPDFTLNSVKGPVSLHEFKNKIVVLYFGYTSCPDVCPATLSELRQALARLGSDADKVQVIFISVDWKRDTAEKMDSYVQAFRPDFIGLSGSESQIDAVTKDFGIYYKINQADKNGYFSVDHTAGMMVLNRQGELVLTWPFGVSSDDILDDLNLLLN